LVRGRVGDDAAGVEADHPFGEAHDRAHDVLDHDDRHARPIYAQDDTEHLVDLDRGQACHHFVQDHHARPCRQGTRHLELAQIDLGQRAGPSVGFVGETHSFE
jgi:hypothetical protein